MLLNRIDIINEGRQKDPLQILGIIPNKIPSLSRMTQKDKVALAKLYDKKGATAKHMTRFFISKRDCYRVMERPSVDASHFEYVHNHHALTEMQKLYDLVETKLWGDSDNE
jgi:chromosome partitioning protein